MGEEVLTKRFLVEGKVQGVFFRASTKAEAERLGLRGYARNLADGRVEVVATGKPKALLALTRWLYRGRRRPAWTQSRKRRCSSRYRPKDSRFFRKARRRAVRPAGEEPAGLHRGRAAPISGTCVPGPFRRDWHDSRGTAAAECRVP